MRRVYRRNISCKICTLVPERYDSCDCCIQCIHCEVQPAVRFILSLGRTSNSICCTLSIPQQWGLRESGTANLRHGFCISLSTPMAKCILLLSISADYRIKLFPCISDLCPPDPFHRWVLVDTQLSFKVPSDWYYVHEGAVLNSLSPDLCPCED